MELKQRNTKYTTIHIIAIKHIKTFKTIYRWLQIM